MGAGQRLGLIAVAVAVAVAAFVVLRPGDDEDEPAGGQPSAQTAPSQDTGGEASAPAPEPQVEQVEIANGQVRGGGERRIRVDKGDTARIDVRSDVPDEIHLHGYDVTRQVRPGRPARFRLEADIEGVFEFEAHDLGHLVVAELVVEP